MHILLVKTSSLGDVFHTLPALSDARQAIPNLRVDWVVEEAFTQIPGWHPAVARVIPIAWRRWRSKLTNKQTRAEMRHFYHDLRATHYDAVIDAQGLIKSALVTRLARGSRYGLDRRSARESLASLAYQHHLHIPKGQHAIHRLRQLLAHSLGYDMSDGALNNTLNYGIDTQHWPRPEIDTPYVVFLHGSTWTTKLWPQAYWQQLRDQAINAGFQVIVPWGNAEERERAQVLADNTSQAQVFEKAPLSDVARLLAHAHAVIGVDTGLLHVAAALDVPTIALYGATDPTLTGPLGSLTRVLQSEYSCAPCLNKKCRYESQTDKPIFPPCYQELDPQRVWHATSQMIKNRPG